MTFLNQAVLKDLEIVRLILKKHPKIDMKDKEGNTPLHIICFNINEYTNNDGILMIQELLLSGADINAQTNEGFTPLMLVTEFNNIEAVKALLNVSDINLNLKNKYRKTAYDIALAKRYREIVYLLKPKSSKKWKGSSKADIEKYDAFFKAPIKWTTCPICLDFVERTEGCMFIMGHNCAKTGHHYNKELYETYAFERYRGHYEVEWCTVCGRITENHRHFKLVLASSDIREFANIDSNIERRLNEGNDEVFFQSDNCRKFGGGGIEEKVARFRRLREYALDLQDDIDIKLEEDALDELIEETWNAPLRRESKKIKKILEEKKFNISSSNFPNVIPNVTRNNNRNYPNIPMIGLKPTISDIGSCIISGEDAGDIENPLYEFHHHGRGGKNHKELLICKDDLEGAIIMKNKEFGIERFGKCWENTCNAILYPGELEGIISDKIYQDYRKKFNKKIKDININKGNENYANENEWNRRERLQDEWRNRQRNRGGKRIIKTRKNKKGNQEGNQEGGDIDHVLHKLDVSTVTCNRVFKKK